MTRRLAGVLSACAVVAAVLTATPATPTAAAADEAARREPQLIVQSITPKAPGPHSTVRISGRLTGGNQPLDEVSVRLRFSSSAFSSRSAMDVYAAGAQSPLFDTRPLGSTSVSVAGHLRPGESRSFTVSVPVGELNIEKFGTYPIAVEALSGGQRVALQRTFLPYVPGDSRIKPTRIAWMWPLIDRPHRTANSTFIDNGLEEGFSADGRLGRLLDAAMAAPAPQGRSQFPLLWAVDPALLQAAQEMADDGGYEVQKRSDGKVVEHEPSKQAQAWLDRVREAVDGQTVFSMPYADPDVMALHRAGLDKSLTLAITSGEEITEGVLNRQVTPDVVWPPGGWLNQDTLDTLAVAGTNTVILNERSLPPARSLTYTPNVATQTPKIGGTISALIADSTLTRILGHATKTPGSAVLKEQRFLAETAFITDERPYAKGTLLVAPPRRWNPPPGFARDVLADSAQVPWLRPVGLSYLKDHPSTVDRASLRYPPSARHKELSQEYLAEVREIHEKMKRFTSILEPGASTFDFTVLRTESSAWREHPAQGRRLRGRVREELAEARSKVRILPSEPVVLASNSGKVGVTIANLLEDHTVNVGLEVRPRNRARIDISSVPERISIPPEHRTTPTIHVETVTTGVAEVTLQLTTLQGQEIGKPVHLEIRAAGYGGVALGVTVGAVAVLFVAAAVRLVRRTVMSGPGEADAEEPSFSGPDEAAATQNGEGQEDEPHRKGPT